MRFTGKILFQVLEADWCLHLINELLDGFYWQRSVLGNHLG